MQTKISGDEPFRCFLCQRYGKMQVHHCLHGSRRKAADAYGLTVHLCPMCHTLLHDHGTNDLYLEQLAQNTFEREHSREDWMKIFGKSYL